MICKNCKKDNAPLKKRCERCGKSLYGITVNNVTGEVGMRMEDGSFKSVPGIAKIELLDNLGNVTDEIVIDDPKSASASPSYPDTNTED